MNKNKLTQGFTLLEILLVVGIIAILAGIVIVAINPSRQLAATRNTERLSDIKQLNNALQQYYIDNGEYPDDVELALDWTEICDTGDQEGSGVVECGDLADLADLVPTYLVAIPVDPQGPDLATLFSTPVYAAEGGTGYYVIKPSTKIALNTINAELGVVIAIGTTTAMTGGGGGEGGCGDPTNPDCWSSDNITNGSTAWSTAYTVTNALSETDGSANTATILTFSTGGDYPAAEACYNLTEGGHTDWYLPAQQQLIDAYNTSVTGFQSGYYWTSTESSSYSAGLWNMNGGFGGYDDKVGPYNAVRCLR